MYKDNFEKEIPEDIANAIVFLASDIRPVRKFGEEMFKLGVNWQQKENKSLYTEEEVLEIIDSLFHRYASSFRIDAKEDFVQFKK